MQLLQTNEGTNDLKWDLRRDETREQIECLDEGLSLSFVDASLKSCSCQYSQNYGLPCRHQFSVAYFCGLKSITIDCVDEFWCRIDNKENSFSSNEIHLRLLKELN